MTLNLTRALLRGVACSVTPLYNVAEMALRVLPSLLFTVFYFGQISGNDTPNLLPLSTTRGSHFNKFGQDKKTVLLSLTPACVTLLPVSCFHVWLAGFRLGCSLWLCTHSHTRTQHSLSSCGPHIAWIAQILAEMKGSGHHGSLPGIID